MKRIKSILTRSILTTILTISAVIVSTPGQLRADYAEDLTIDVWLDRGDGGVYNRGDAVTVYFKTNADCFVTLYNIDTDGYTRVLFPSYTGEGNYVQGGKTYAVPANQHENFFVIDEATGIGYIEGVASPRPFYLEGWPFYTQRDGEGHYADVAIERISGDPFLGMEEINQKILPFGEDAVFSDDFALYYVEEVVSHPRYMCNDCHYSDYYHHDPYQYNCSHIDIVVFDYWWYNRWFYCDYWWVDYSYYYDYYYYAPPPAYLGRRYTRKYGYTTKGYGDRGGSVRVNDYYRGKDNYRGDFKPIGVKNNSVISYKLPKNTNEPGYGTRGSIQKRDPVMEGQAGNRNVSKPAPHGQAGSDYIKDQSGKNIQNKGPVYDGGRNDSQGRNVTGKTPQSDWSTPAQSGSKVERSGGAIEDGNRGGRGGRSSVMKKAPAKESDRSRSTNRKEYQLNGWDKGKSGDSKKKSSISIIKSRPSKSDRKPSSGSKSISSSRSKPSSKTISRPRSNSGSSKISRPSPRSNSGSSRSAKPSSGSSRGSGTKVRRK